MLHEKLKNSPIWHVCKVYTSTKNNNVVSFTIVVFQAFRLRANKLTIKLPNFTFTFLYFEKMQYNVLHEHVYLQ